MLNIVPERESTLPAMAYCVSNQNYICNAIFELNLNNSFLYLSS